MNIFQEGIKQGVRFNTSKGMLSIEQMYHLKVTPLATIIRDLKKQLGTDSDDGLAFLDSTVTVDKSLELQFNIAKAIYLDKVEERDAEKTAAANKEHNAKIDALIAQKQDESLGEKSVEELIAMRK